MINMTSNDNQQFITVEVFRSEIGDLRTEIRDGFQQINNDLKDIRTEIQAVRDIAISNSAKIDAHWEAASMWFSFIAILVAGIGAVAAFIPIFREHSNGKNITEQKVQSMIDASVSQAVNDAISKVMGVSGK